MARNNNAYPKEFWDKVKADRDQGSTYKELSEKHDIAKSTLSYHFRQYNLPPRKVSNPGKIYNSPIGPLIRAKKNGYSKLKKHIESRKRKSIKKRLYARPVGPRYMLIGKKLIQSKINIDPETGCWNWAGSCTSAGYGQLMIDRKYWTAHRYSYTIYKKEIDENLIIRHICHNTRCCNPHHLLEGTHSDNWRDSANLHIAANKRKGKTVYIDDVRYESIRSAAKETGIDHRTIKNHSKDSVFDINSYRAACERCNVKPKI